MGNARGELTERSKFLRLNEAILCRSQVLERPRKVIRALSKFVEQPRILDGDDGLIGKGGDRFNLSVGKFSDLCPNDYKDADRLPFACQRNAQAGAVVASRVVSESLNSGSDRTSRT